MSQLLLSSQDAIVFVIGGGNYTEYQNLMSYASSSSSSAGSKSSSVRDDSHITSVTFLDFF